VCSWFVNVIDGALLVVAHGLDAPLHSVLITHLFDYKYIYGIWILEVRREGQGEVGKYGEKRGGEGKLLAPCAIEFIFVIFLV